MAKMFVHYKGTKEAFIAAGLPSQYTNSIVFIKGGEDGTGAAIYTRGNYYANVEEALAALKYFGKIKAGDNVAQAAGPDGIITFTADDPASVAVKVDERGVHLALTDEFKTAVNTTLPNRIAAIEGDYLKAADKTELEGKVNTALADAKKYTDDEVSRIVADSGSGLVGSAGDTSSADTIYGAKKYADEKAAAAQAAAEATAAADATGKVDAAKAEIKGTTDALEGRVASNESAIATLNGEDAGKSAREIVQDEVAKQLTSENITESFDTLKEMAEYLSSHPQDVTDMNAAIAAADTKAAQGVSDAAAAKSAADAAQAAADAAQQAVDAVTADYLKAADKTELQGNIDKKVAQADYDTKIAALEAKDAELEAMWGWEEL